jgi:hypothetical protein
VKLLDITIEVDHHGRQKELQERQGHEKQKGLWLGRSIDYYSDGGTYTRIHLCTRRGLQERKHQMGYDGQA